MKVNIREATSKDIPTIKECLIDSWTTHAKNVPDLLDEGRMRNSKVEEYYKKALKKPDASFIFIAEVEGEFAGFIRADVQEIASFFKYPRILFIDDVYVLEKFRRKGVANLLIKNVEKIAKEKGIKRIQARVYSFNEPTKKLLESSGYSSPYATWDKRV